MSARGISHEYTLGNSSYQLYNIFSQVLNKFFSNYLTMKLFIIKQLWVLFEGNQQGIYGIVYTLLPMLHIESYLLDFISLWFEKPSFWYYLCLNHKSNRLLGKHTKSTVHTHDQIALGMYVQRVECTVISK